MFLQMALFSSFLWLSNGNPLQYSCLENPMGGGAQWVTVHGVAKSWTRLSGFSFPFTNILLLFLYSKKSNGFPKESDFRNRKMLHFGFAFHLCQGPTQENKIKRSTYVLPHHTAVISTSVCMCACQVSSVVSDTLRPHGLQPTRLLCPWDSPGKNTGVGCPALLQELNLCLLCLLHCR